jgi:phage gpG-like protein
MIDASLLNRLGIIVVQSITARIRQGKVAPKTNKSGTTLVQSSHLIKSIRHYVKADSVTIGTNLVYARILHEGGIIKPRRAKYLAIPLSPLAAVHKPRDFANTFISKGIIFLAQDAGDPIPLYALKKQVVIPARPYLFLDTPTHDKLITAIQNHVSAHLKSAIKGSHNG